MSIRETQPKRVYYRPTTPQQRRLLFEAYEKSGSVPEACRQAHVGRGTFYYWLPRFRERGYAGLEKERSRAPHRTRIPPIADEIIQEVIAYKRAHPQAGYRSVANGVRQAHGWQPVIGPTKVRKVLIAAGLVALRSPAPPKGESGTVVHAAEPQQTINIDLCVVPVTHSAAEELISTSLAVAARDDFSPTAPDDGEGGTAVSRPGL
jgi:hypothetical protein